MSPTPDLAARQRHTARLLARFLREHPDLPVIDWTVSPHRLHAQLYLCDADPNDQRAAFTAWTTTLSLAQARDPGDGVAEIHVHRYLDDVQVLLTATIHPF